MKVTILRDWFAPNAVLMKPGRHDVPDEWRGLLPVGSTIDGGEKSPPSSPDGEPAKRRGRPHKAETRE